MQAVKAPEAAGTKKGAVIVAWEEKQPYPAAIFITADKPEDGSYYCEHFG